MSQRDPTKRLTIVDKFDLDSPEERRIALFTLNDYFGAVFAEVGEQLDFRTSDYGMSIGHQWNKASSRLNDVDSVDIPEEYDRVLRAVDELRGNYAHDFRDYPPLDPIESAKETAPNWTDWIHDVANEYEKYQESMTATEALVQIGERTLDHNIGDQFRYPSRFHTQVDDLRDQAADLKKDLRPFTDDDEVTKEFVEVISDILKWERDRKEFEEELEKWEKEAIRQKEREDKAEKSSNFIVVDEVDESDSISLVRHEVGKPDETLTFTVSNCPISKGEMDFLRDLETNDEVRLWVGTNMYRNKRGNIDHDSIIKEIVRPDNIPNRPSGYSQ
jgi:hypothetical protein